MWGRGAGEDGGGDSFGGVASLRVVLVSNFTTGGIMTLSVRDGG